MENKNKKGFFSFLFSFSKILTIVWIVAWIETILFSQLATIFRFGDALSIQYIVETVTEIGVIIVGFYFSSKTVENVAKGIQRHKINLLDREEAKNNTDDSDSENIPIE